MSKAQTETRTPCAVFGQPRLPPQLYVNSFGAMKQIGSLLVLFAALSQVLDAIHMNSTNQVLKPGSSRSIRSSTSTNTSNSKRHPKVQLLTFSQRSIRAWGSLRSRVPPGPMTTVTHDKEAGGGYEQGSPLYDKQQDMHAQQSAALTPMVPAEFAKHKWAFLWSILFEILLALLIAYLYRRFKKQPDGHRFPRPYPSALAGELSNQSTNTCGFSSPFCLCYWGNWAQDWHFYLTACCCPMIRWADTVGADHIQLLPYWAAIFMWLSVEIFIVLICVYILGPQVASELAVIFIFIGVYYRQKLRVLYGHDACSFKSLCCDCLAWWCCPCCAIVQESLEVEYYRPSKYGDMDANFHTQPQSMR